MTRANYPKGLGPAGKRLLRDVRAKYTLDPRETVLAEEAARLADQVSRIDFALAGTDPAARGARGQLVAHPLLKEARQHRLAMAALLGKLDLPVEEVEPTRTRSSALARLREAQQRG
jgi:hypothetical protein